jgi:hypothetical protein
LLGGFLALPVIMIGTHCQGNLHSEPAKTGVALFCPWAKCDCPKMNDGVEALGLDQAYATLVDVFNSWLGTRREA